MKAKDIILEYATKTPDPNDRYLFQGNISKILMEILNDIPNGTKKQYIDALITESGNILLGRIKREELEPISICEHETQFFNALYIKISDIAFIIDGEATDD